MTNQKTPVQVLAAFKEALRGENEGGDMRVLIDDLHVLVGLAERAPVQGGATEEQIEAAAAEIDRIPEWAMLRRHMGFRESRLDELRYKVARAALSLSASADPADERHYAEERQAASPSPGKRLDPEFRATLVDFAAASIRDVWADVPEGVDAETLASNVVSAQEFAWISRGFPVAQAEGEDHAATVTGEIHEPNHDRVYCVRCGGRWPCDGSLGATRTGDREKLEPKIGDVWVHPYSGHKVTVLNIHTLYEHDGPLIKFSFSDGRTSVCLQTSFVEGYRFAAPVEVDEAKLAEVINSALDAWQGEKASEVFVARAIAAWLRGEGHVHDRK